ncbi:MAG: hypothetical protein M1825_003410 [Sarcosagium campestre]|nr:MAG: hypothetical protein M1825_003410 [Sarcosagium campestre]
MDEPLPTKKRGRPRKQAVRNSSVDQTPASVLEAESAIHSDVMREPLPPGRSAKPKGRTALKASDTIEDVAVTRSTRAAKMRSQGPDLGSKSAKVIRTERKMMIVISGLKTEDLFSTGRKHAASSNEDDEVYPAVDGSFRTERRRIGVQGYRDASEDRVETKVIDEAPARLRADSSPDPSSGSPSPTVLVRPTGEGTRPQVSSSLSRHSDVSIESSDLKVHTSVKHLQSQRASEGQEEGENHPTAGHEIAVESDGHADSSDAGVGSASPSPRLDEDAMTPPEASTEEDLAAVDAGSLGPYRPDEWAEEEESSVEEGIEAFRYRALTSPEDFHPALSSPERRSSYELYVAAEAAAAALCAWQKEYHEIEYRVAIRLGEVPKENGTIDEDIVYEDKKEADLYGYTWNPAVSRRGIQDPVAQRVNLVAGRAPTARALNQEPAEGSAGIEAVVRRRGRPRKVMGIDVADLKETVEPGPAVQRRSQRQAVASKKMVPEPDGKPADAPKKRGRPRTRPIPTHVQPPQDPGVETEATIAPAPKRRGRPPKHLNSTSMQVGPQPKKQKIDDLREEQCELPPKRLAQDARSSKVMGGPRTVRSHHLQDVTQQLADIETVVDQATPGVEGEVDTPGPSLQPPSAIKARARGGRGGRGQSAPSGGKVGNNMRRDARTTNDKSARDANAKRDVGAVPAALTRTGLTEFERFQLLSSGESSSVLRARRIPRAEVALTNAEVDPIGTIEGHDDVAIKEEIVGDGADDSLYDM